MTYSKLKNEVLDNGFCSGCGTCVGVCPQNCLEIHMKESQNPILVNESACISCGLCYEVCPGKGCEILREKTVNEKLNYSNEIGYYHKLFTGYSLNKRIREESASGGIATTVIEYFLKQHLADCALIVSMKNGLPFIETIENPDDATRGLQSKYGFIPLNTKLKEINESNKKYIIVGVPCHLQGIEKASKYLKSLKNNIVFKIGLLCGYTQTYDSLSYIKKVLHLDYKEDYQFIGWRYGAYPGNMAFKNRKNGKIQMKSLYEWLAICVPFFTMNKCFLCPDGTNEFADIVLGDVHSKGNEENCIISRNSYATRVLEDMANESKMVFNEINYSEAMKYPIGSVSRTKGRAALIVIDYLKKRGMPSPKYNIEKPKIGKLSRYIIIEKYRLYMFLRYKWVRKFLLKSPKFTEILGDFAYRFPKSVPGFNLGMRVIKKLRRE